jgi:hypothetical protein
MSLSTEMLVVPFLEPIGRYSPKSALNAFEVDDIASYTSPYPE